MKNTTKRLWHKNKNSLSAMGFAERRIASGGSLTFGLFITILIVMLNQNAIAAEFDWEGIWTADPAWCEFADRIGEHDPAPIEITRQKMVGLENRCDVVKISKRKAETALSLRCTGEGEEYTDKIFVTAKNNILKLRHSDGTVLSFTRCLSKFKEFSDKELMDLAFWMNQICRGTNFSDRLEEEYICRLRNESWSALGRRGYCYDHWGNVMFPRCGDGGEPMN